MSWRYDSEAENNFYTFLDPSGVRELLERVTLLIGEVVVSVFERVALLGGFLAVVFFLAVFCSDGGLSAEGVLFGENSALFSLNGVFDGVGGEGPLFSSFCVTLVF